MSQSFNNQTSMSDLLKLISELQEKFQEQTKFQVQEAYQKFVLDKFDGKSDASLFIDRFEMECHKFGVNKEEKKIEILKIFVTDKSTL